MYLSNLTLVNFRNHTHLDLTDLHPKCVVLTGLNGVGKTNILEAISFLSPGRGLRRASLEETRNTDNAAPWAVSARLEVGRDTHQIGTGEDQGKRIVRINGKNAGQVDLGDFLNILWLTPQMDRLFVDSASQRRRFVDRLVYGFEHTHLQNLTHYETAMRERLRLLKDNHFNDDWLKSLEREMGMYGAKIVKSRNKILGIIEEESAGGHSHFPEILCRMVSEKADDLAQILKDNRMIDAKTGMTGVGPHRDDLEVIFKPKNTPAGVCSTGEQKAMLIAIILANARAMSRIKGGSPILLLDEIAAHLDEGRKSHLFEELLAFSSQVWLTGTEKNLFTSLIGKAGFIEIFHDTNGRENDRRNGQ